MASNSRLAGGAPRRRSDRLTSPRALRALVWCAALSACLLAGGCGFFGSTCDEDDADCLGRHLKGANVGGQCDRTVECRSGLRCEAGVCVPRGDAPEGTSCARTAECDEGLYCSSTRECNPAGSGEVGSECQDSGDCTAGLRCDISPRGVPFRCAAAGTKELGQECQGSECVAGLTCIDFEGVSACRSQPKLDVELPSLAEWDGAECGKQEDDLIAYFEVPRDGEDMEFYRLPFPNDIRVAGGKVDLSDHPRPPDKQIPIAARFIEAGDGELEGFATNAVAYFRFSKEIDGSTLDRTSIQIVDITPSSPSYDRWGSIGFFPKTQSFISNYVCPHAVAVRRPIGQPLRPKTTYAAIVTSGVRPAEGGTFARSPDFDAMLANATPADSDLVAAHQVYAPLRDWIDNTEIDADSLVNAAVFTTLDPERPIAGLAAAVADLGVPRTSDLRECGSAVTSPCETKDTDGSIRGACRNSGDGFTEIHGRITLPVFQEGTLPYLETGGAIATNSNGDPQVTGEADVCFALAVPDGDPPETGWPLLIYGHGTGGSFTGQMGAGGFAEEMATGSSPAATLAIDLPMHGDRRGESEESPELLFFNITNPPAARDNVLQGSADLLSLLQFATRGSISADDSPTDAEISFNGDRIAIMGHSQGATHAALMMSYSASLAATVLSGVGGHLVSSLLNKSKPLPISDAIGAVLFDLDGDKPAARDYNPALSLVQHYYEAADPINFARRVHTEPTAVDPDGTHLFMTYGLNDSFSPEATQKAYAQAADLSHVGTALRPLSLPMVAAPASNTVMVGATERTVGVQQYQDEGDDDDDNLVDGHFVAVSQSGPGRPDVVAFLRAVMAGETPTIGD